MLREYSTPAQASLEKEENPLHHKEKVNKYISGGGNKQEGVSPAAGQARGLSAPYKFQSHTATAASTIPQCLLKITSSGHTAFQEGNQMAGPASAQTPHLKL